MTIAEHVGLDDVTRSIPDPDPATLPYNPADSWQPINLATLEARAIEPPTLAHGLLYPGRRHLWSGEPESAKSWAALIACAQQIQIANAVLYIDFETDEHEISDRLNALGIQRSQLDQRFVYVRPSDPIGATGVRDHLDRMIAAFQPRIAVIDAYAGALDLHELDPNKGADIEKLNRVLFEPLRAHGAAVVILDHLTKDREKRGRFSIGSERKVGVVDVHLGFETVKTFGRGRTGLVHVQVHKDRPGYLQRPRVAELHLESDLETGQIAHRIEAPQQHDEEHPFRPTVLMEKVSRWVEDQPEPPSRNAIETGVTGNRDALRIAIDTLVKDEYLSVEEGPRNSKLHTSIRAYRAALDPTQTTSPPLRPHFAQGEDDDFAQTCSPLTGEQGEVVANSNSHLARENQGEVQGTLGEPVGTNDPDADIPF